MEKHTTVLAALLIGLGIMGLIGILVLLMVFGIGSAVLGTVAAQDPEMPPLLVFLPASFGALISVLIALTTVPCLVAAWGLLKRRPWAGLVALIAGVINLPVFPMGTAVGLYAIWVFLQEDSFSPTSVA